MNEASAIGHNEKGGVRGSKAGRLTHACLARHSLIAFDLALPARIAGFVFSRLSLPPQDLVNVSARWRITVLAENLLPDSITRIVSLRVAIGATPSRTRFHWGYNATGRSAPLKPDDGEMMW